MKFETDVAIIGGALSGSAVALLLLREAPGLRILLLEKSEVFDRKVGEATTEVSGEFFHRRLALANHLIHEHLAKQSLRMWFTSTPETPFDETVEIGAKLQSHFPAFQIDRAIFDQHLLETAEREGATVWRPASVLDAQVGGQGPATLQVEKDGQSIEVTCRWVIDASGRTAFLSKKLGLFQKVPEHPTAALWARFSGVADWDGFPARSRHPRYGSTALTSRAAATNHLVGRGWWCWIIPLRGGDFSAGLVYDTRLFSLPPGPSPAARLKAHILTHPVGREFFSEAEPIEGDVKALAQLPYQSTQIAGSNWQICGDAAGFIDPLYSPGMDFCSWTARIAFARIARESRGETINLDKLNADWQESYRTWFEAICQDKYEYIGDAQLMSAAYLFDIGLFFLGPARSSLLEAGGDDLWCLPFIGPVDRVVGKFMKFYNQRLVAIARKRLASGCYGLHNSGWQELYTGIGPQLSVSKILFKALFRWMHAELHAARLPASDSHDPPRVPDVMNQPQNA